jgi:hypothetical protein
MNVRDDFMAELDAQLVKPADAIVILRNHNDDITLARLKEGMRLMAGGYSKTMVMLHQENTAAEAQRFADLMLENAGYKSIILVTHRYHHYRAFLTFAQAINYYALSIAMYSWPVPSWNNAEEFDKIEAYQKKGDVATYEGGLAWLRTQI